MIDNDNGSLPLSQVSLLANPFTYALGPVQLKQGGCNFNQFRLYRVEASGGLKEAACHCMDDLNVFY